MSDDDYLYKILSMSSEAERSIVRSFSLKEREIRMLSMVARYHGLSKSGAIRALVRKEFWRIFPAGTEDLLPERGARIKGDESEQD